jgi:predicted phosphohydrolase
MAIWAIADIHASRLDPDTRLPTKPMDVFGEHWEDHVDRLERAWMDRVSPQDTVIVAGDLDWALRLEQAQETLHRLDAWSGKKILVRGNHDYWWSSKSTNKVRRALPPSLYALHNDAVQADGFNICGTKGSPVPGAMDWTDENAKLLNREVGRLKRSLAARDPSLRTIVALHYPPYFPSTGTSPFREIIDEAGAAWVVYGHLHGDAASTGPSGRQGSANYSLVAADAVGFEPVLIAMAAEAAQAQRSGIA